MPRTSAQSSAYGQLERRLLLNGWVLRQFGYDNNELALQDLSQAAEGVDAEGRSFVFHRLIGRGNRLLIPPDELASYDDNVRRHLTKINSSRAEKIELRYFQQAALLFTELLLHRLSTDRQSLVSSLNEFVEERNSRRAAGDPFEDPFEPGDLSRLAFWMATGSGKTLLLHINYLQFIHYRRTPTDNILLITPNEGLSLQHIEELALSGIPADRFRLDESGLRLGSADTIRVLEITKLVEDKRGGGVRVPIEQFEGTNLIFVDEGHRGSGGETWRRYRDALAATGFTFEYSATFAQALTSAANDELTRAYGKWIAFDYSYRYFHRDGFGKDFRIINLQRDSTEANTRLLLLGNLLSFYEQQMVFREAADAVHKYNLAPPLWIFVGSSVNAVYTASGRTHSDVLTVMRFVQAFLRNSRQWSINSIRRILDERTGLRDSSGRDIFAERLRYLRSRHNDASALYHDILAHVFHAPDPAGLVIRDLKGQPGELGLRASNGTDDFGVVYIGDTPAFKRIVQSDDAGIDLEEDVVSGSLFQAIGSSDSNINILVGAKKFMEGWNSWRVSSMSLLNIGRSEGSEVIQLFGRGVRLLGLGRSLRRSTSVDGVHPPHIGILETLNVFGVRANYMAQFRSYLEREGVDPDGHIIIPVKIRPNRPILERGLLIPRVPDVDDFVHSQALLLVPDPSATVSIDLSPRIETLEGASTQRRRVQSGVEQRFTEAHLRAIDWDATFASLVDYKIQKGYSNIVILRESLPSLMSHDPPLYSLIAEPGLLAPSSFDEARRLETVVLIILRKYLTKFFRVFQERWETSNMVYRAVDSGDPNFRDYQVGISRGEATLIAAVEALIREGTRLWREDTLDLPTIHLDEHLYQPLLVQRSPHIRSDPPGLGDSEARFVEDLRRFLRAEAGRRLAGKEIFVLRNLTRGKGVGFFENEGFFPDFLVWILEGERQRLVFVEPHGMFHEKTYWTSDKAQLHRKLARLSQRWQALSPGPIVELDSFIVSKTSYSQLRRYYGSGEWTVREFEERHILFFESPDYVASIFDASSAHVAAGG